ncbi:MAG: hypothetical protein CFH28_00869 [Alphaproteobacteria bacterium MarineAlpha6_Bin6]|nr:hypothetical protein [Pelagibacteraceae bacterium]PPR29992.1 MAG: hypothetical protein CFH28_00869 [Alphaproteobacteria bacterium MarineAlpha6_Bin6]PPR33219.1 MAG: hypothetical protein CFH27_00637 [Alphaproteobacteria bacterium MarineAlpha6_Bin5]
MNKKLLYPLYGIVFFFVLSIIFITSFTKNSMSKEIDPRYPATRWLEIDNYIGGSKSSMENSSKNKTIEPIKFAEDISIPELPNLTDIPLTNEDK